jgi:cyclase
MAKSHSAGNCNCPAGTRDSKPQTTALGKMAYTKGLHDLGNNAYAWLQPDGGWGWSNAGLIVDGDQSLLVDTLFDARLTAQMLKAMRSATSSADTIETLVNTHSNGDHCNGNELVVGAEIITSKATSDEMPHEDPAVLADILDNADQMGDLGTFFKKCFGDFDFRSVNRLNPTLTFEGEMTRFVGDKKVELIEVGPEHTKGDILVHVPQDKCVFTGDILFIEGHPIMWEGPVSNWLSACDKMLAMDVETIVPGHGAITDKTGVRAVKYYLEYVRDEARKRFDAGQDMKSAAMEICLDDFDSWGDSERIVINVSTLYKEFAGNDVGPTPVELFGLMAELDK